MAAACGLCEINTPARVAAFLAQVGHESGGFRYTTEIWGPTTAQQRYDGRKDLGNPQPGDGSRFRGHGLIQTTGRYNHARVRDRLRQRLGPDVPDFEAQPELLAADEWAATSAADYWDDKGLNAPTSATSSASTAGSTARPTAWRASSACSRCSQRRPTPCPSSTYPPLRNPSPQRRLP